MSFLFYILLLILLFPLVVVLIAVIRVKLLIRKILKEQEEQFKNIENSEGKVVIEPKKDNLNAEDVDYQELN